MSAIATSISAFRGFNSHVLTTRQWFTQGKTVDLTEYVYGKQEPSLISKGFNIVKWMQRIASIKKLIKILQKKLIKTLKRFGRKLIKNTIRKITSFTKFVVKKGKKYIINPIKKICKLLTKGTFKPFKFVYDKLTNIVKKIGNKVRNLVVKIGKNVFKFIRKKIIKPVIKAIEKLLPKLKAIIGDLINTLRKLLKNGFKKVTNLVVSKGKSIFNFGRTTIVKSGKAIKGFVGGTVKFFKNGTNKVVSKIVGLGKDAKDLAVRTKNGVIAAGKSAADWMKYTKRKWKVGLKFFKHRAKMKWFKFIKTNKLAKMGVAMFKWAIKLIKWLLKAAKIIKPVVASTATATAGPTAGISLIVPLIIGLIIEFITYGPLLKQRASYILKFLYTLGRYVLSVLSWAFPVMGLADAMLSFAELFKSQTGQYLKWLINGYDSTLLLKAANLIVNGSDVIFTHDTAQRIDTVKDLQKNVIASQFLLVKQCTDKFNNAAIKLINYVVEKQILRSNYLNQCVNAI